MNIYLCSDIEGSCGFTAHEEGRPGSPLYEQFRRQMTLEASAACSGAKKAGGELILVHDAHGNARNIIADLLPYDVELMRMSGCDLYSMLSGVQDGEFDAVMFTGFHSGATNAGSPVCHTFSTTLHHAMYLNGMPLSEFLFYTYTAASLKLPVPFVSGDKALCEFARELVPGITTVEAVTGFGAGTRSRHPKQVIEEIERKAELAFSGDWKQCMPKLPSEFEMTMVCQRPYYAKHRSFYPGMEQIDDVTIRFATDKWEEMLRMVHFCC